MTRPNVPITLVIAMGACALAACGSPVGGTDGAPPDRVDAARPDSVTPGMDVPPGMDAPPGMDTPPAMDTPPGMDVPPGMDTPPGMDVPPADTMMGCGATQHMCGATCVDNSDPAFGCGATACTPCSVPNATATCAGTNCTVGTCNTGFADCDRDPGNGCEADTRVSNANCGACGRACGATETCMAGTCTASTMCPMPGQVRCGGVCTSTQTDNMNCGACGTVCPAGTACTAGRCACSAAGTTLCGSACVNTMTDAANCGACGNACAGGTTCVAGACVCPAGQTNCSGTCRNLTTDTANCGSCGNACGAGQACTASLCVCTGAGQTNCSGTCRTLASDSANCGACGNACPAGQVCTAGVCGCPAGQTNCAGTCRTLATDSANCGACGNACGAGQACTAGACQCTTAGQLNCGGTCRTVATDNANCGACGVVCGGGSSCVAGVCTCPAGQTLCGGVCRNLATDTSNCGTCGHACAAGQTCTAGACVASMMCPAGQTNCSGTCRDLTSDASNCGGCGTVCPAGHTCTAGACTCPAGQTDCSGTCRALTTDSSNCGACGNVCTAGRTCVSGVCACAAGQTFCGGACVNTATNNTYCAPSGTTCGVTCAGGQTCVAGACACPAGQTFCGGACVNTATNNTYCAPSGTTCGSACTGGQSCVSGACTCPAGQRLCGGSCVDTTTSNTYCAPVAAMSCGVPCAAAQTCTGGTCVCPASTPTFCAATMSCVNTVSDNANCGTCGHACPVLMPTCVGGACTALPPPNDTRASAAVIDLSVPTSTYNPTFVGSHSDTTPPAACLGGFCSGGTNGDVFYRFTLTQPEIVYVDTFGSYTGSGGNTDTILFLQDAAGTNLASAGTTGGATCNDDHTTGCSGSGTSSLDSALVARLPGVAAGTTYYLVLKQCNTTSTSAAVHFHHEPAGNGVARQIAPGATTASIAGTTAGTGILAGSCTVSLDAPEDVAWFTTCPGSAAQSLHAETCGSGYDTVLYERSSTRGSADVCEDDNSTRACNLQSSITPTIPAGAGLHVVYVDGFGSSAGAYTLTYRMPPCVAGFALCGGVCVETQSNDSNCGGCGIVCGANTACTGGVCRPVNDDCAPSFPGSTGAIPITLNAPGTATVVTMGTSTVNATDSAMSPWAGGADVWFSFSTGPSRELVYINTFGTTTFDPMIGVTNGCGTPLLATQDDSFCGSTCVGPGCEGRNSSMAVALDPGTHYLAVDVRTLSPGAFSLAIQRIASTTFPVGMVTPNFLVSGGYSFMTTTTGAPTRLQTCMAGGSLTPSPETSWLWLSCPGDPGGMFSASTCNTGTNYDTLLQYRNGLGMSSWACNDDAGAACAMSSIHSTISTTTPAGATAHLLTVSGYGGAAGTANVNGVRP